MTNINSASALDMGDLESTNSSRVNNVPVSRRQSRTTSRHLSGQSTRANRLNTRPSQSSDRSRLSKDNQEGTMSPTRAVQAVRDGISSALSKGTEIATNFTSPLAQIYQPLVVDDDLRDDQAAELTQPNMVSYGPASRRRLSSMHRFPPAAPLDMRRSGSRGQHAFPVQESPRSIGDVKQGRAGGESPMSTPEPASQALEDEGGTGSTLQLITRLSRIEERQKRLEDLILQLTSDLKASKH